MTRSRLNFIACGILPTLFAAHAAPAAEWKVTLENSLKANYKLTRAGLDRVRITDPGTLLTIRKENISGDLASDATALDNKVIDGRVEQGHGFKAGLQHKDTNREFKPGERVYVLRITVRDDAVEFFVVSGETYGVNLRGSTRQTRYTAKISFMFPKDFLPTAPPGAVQKVINDVIAAGGSIPVPTVSLGQTPQEVEAALGKPESDINLGAKVTYIYKTMKVVFQDGKVADVQ